MGKEAKEEHAGIVGVGHLWLQSGKCWDMVLIGQPRGDVYGTVVCQRWELKRVEEKGGEFGSLGWL